MAEKMIVWKDRDNPTYIQLQENEVNLTPGQMEAITKAEIYFDGNYYNSNDNPECFDLTTMKDESTLILHLGLLPLHDGYAENDLAELILYDAVNTNGVVWMQFVIIIKTDAEVIS